ncbi:MAG: hypothetical protein H7098_04940, partial [Oligoflexus sp.]|nr:hypothetical protein [Pseudopedobacter sp.]
LGGLSILSSIPLFIASGRNKRKAANASAFFNIEKVNDDPLALHRINYKPTLSVKISF